MFKVAIKEIQVKELPEINDDFAADVSEFETLAEYKADLRTKLVAQKEASRKAEIENKAIDTAVENAKVVVPEAMIEEQVDRNVREFSMRMSQQGLNLEQYFQFTGLTMEAFRENFKKDAEAQLRSRLVLEKVMEVENIEISDEEVEAEIEKMAARYNMDVANLKNSIGANEREMLASDLRVQKAADVVANTAKVIEK